MKFKSTLGGTEGTEGTGGTNGRNAGGGTRNGTREREEEERVDNDTTYTESTKVHRFVLLNYCVSMGLGTGDLPSPLSPLPSPLSQNQSLVYYILDGGNGSYIYKCTR